MDDLAEEVRKLRDQVRQLRSALDALEAPDVAGGVAILAQIGSAGAFPTSSPAGTVFVLLPVDITGVEAEGDSASLGSRPGTFLAANVGTGLPAQGTYVVAEEVGGNWVFEYE